MARVTARDVGKAAGVHPSTVSRVLNRAFDRHTYAPDTIDRVETTAAKLGYRPALVARALRTGKTMLIGVIVSDIANPFFGEMAAAMEKHARRHGYHVVIGNTGEDPDLQAEHLADMVSRGIDGIVLSPSGSAGCDAVLDAGVPLITVDRPLSSATIRHVGLDNAHAGRMLGEHLRCRGYRRVGVAMPDIPTDPTLTERLSGLRAGLGADGAVAWIETADDEDVRDQVRRGVTARLMAGERAGGPMPDAMVGLTNLSTIGIVQAMDQRGLAAPDQIGVAGIDDFNAADILHPGITVVAQPIGGIAERAVATLVEMMSEEAGGRPPDDQRLAPTLVVRGSLRPSAQ